MNVRAHQLLHNLWSKAVGTEGYDKVQWKELETLIDQLPTESKELIETTYYGKQIKLCRECYLRAANPARQEKL